MIPEDLIFEILLNLSPEIIRRCRDVSKSWQKLIGSRLFIKAQIKRTLRTNSIDSRLIIIPGGQGTSLYSLFFPSPEAENPTVAEVMKLEFPLMGSDNKINLINSCNGLICIENTNLHPYCSCSDYPSIDTSFTLWNPSTGIYRIIPDESINSPEFFKLKRFYSFDSTCYFGFDPYKDDYYIVRVTVSNNNNSAIHFYSLKSNSWTLIQNQIQNTWIIMQRSGVLVNGTLYLISRQKDNDDPPYYHKIIAFDIGFNKNRFIELSYTYRIFYSIANMESILIELKGRLSVLDSPWLAKNKHVVRLMEEDGGDNGSDEIWNKKFMFETPKLMNLSKFLTVGASDGDEIKVLAIFSDQTLKIYDTETKSMTEISIQTEVSEFLALKDACVCLQTIASPSY